MNEKHSNWKRRGPSPITKWSQPTEDAKFAHGLGAHWWSDADCSSRKECQMHIHMTYFRCHCASEWGQEGGWFGLISPSKKKKKLIRLLVQSNVEAGFYKKLTQIKRCRRQAKAKRGFSRIYLLADTKTAAFAERKVSIPRCRLEATISSTMQHDGREVVPSIGDQYFYLRSHLSRNMFTLSKI